MDLLRIIIAILLPPLGVFLQVGIGKHFWINILLTILGYIPGIVHAIWVIAKYWEGASPPVSPDTLTRHHPFEAHLSRAVGQHNVKP
jgi:uncharacterized membrane protein YqaE (UPF0057 family)